MKQSTKIRPIDGFVVTTKEQEDRSGIYLGDDKDDSIGVVVSCGGDIKEDGETIKCPVKEKDKIIYKKYDAINVTVDTEDYSLVPYKSIAGVIK